MKSYLKDLKNNRLFNGENKVIFLYSLCLLPLTIIFAKTEGDTWWSLRGGKDLFKGKDIWKDTWSFTSNNYWPNHEWLSEAFNYLLYNLGNHTLFFNIMANSLFLTIALILPLTFKNTLEKRILKLNFNTLLWYSCICLLILVYYDRLRALTFTILLTVITFKLILEKNFKWLPLLTLLWVNLHAGFIMIFMLLLPLFMVNVLGKNKGESSRAIFETLLLSFVASFFNPLVYRMWLYLFDAPHKNTTMLTEWRPLWEFTPLFAVALLLTLLLTINIFKNFYLTKTSKINKENFNEGVKNPQKFFNSNGVYLTIIFIVLLIMSLLYVRNTVLLILLFTPHSLSLFNKSSKELKKNLHKIIMVIFTMLSIGLSIFFTMNTSHALSTPLTVKEINAINECGGNNKVWNDYSIGGEVIWFTPEIKVYQDSRYDYLNDYIKANPILNEKDYKKLLEGSNVNCLILLKDSESYNFVNGNNYFKKHYEKIFEDESYLILKKK